MSHPAFFMKPGFLAFIHAAWFYQEAAIVEAADAVGAQNFSRMQFQLTMKEGTDEHRDTGPFRIQASCSSPEPLNTSAPTV